MSYLVTFHCYYVQYSTYIYDAFVSQPYFFSYFPGKNLSLKAGMTHKLTHTSPKKNGKKIYL